MKCGQVSEHRKDRVCEKESGHNGFHRFVQPSKAESTIGASSTERVAADE